MASQDGNTIAAVDQCLRVTAGMSYDASLSVYIVSGQAADSAGLSIFFYPTGNCSGALSGVAAPSTTSASNQWTTVGLTAATAPAGAQSMAVRLIVSKPFRDGGLVARFDNVQVKLH
jgi:hypothetical protein